MPSITIQPGSGSELDGWMRQESPDTSGGTDGVLVTGEDNTGVELFRSCVKFSLSSIPSGSIINSVTLTLTHAESGSWRASNSRTVRVYRLLRAFTEGLTWNNYDGSSGWGTAGCSNTTTDREATDIGSSSVTTAELDEAEHEWTLTASSIQAMLDNGSFTNNGFLLKADTESSDRQQWHSGESATASKRPKLVIDYTPPPFGVKIF